MFFSGSIYDGYYSDPLPVGDGSEDLVGYTVTIVNTSGDDAKNPSTVDAEPQYFGYTGISGVMHQHYSDELSADSPMQSDAYATAIDSHWLVDESEIIWVTQPYEDVGFLPSSEPTDMAPPADEFADTSFGTYLRGIWAVMGAEGTASPTRDVAYIVVPAGGMFSVDMFVTGPGGGETVTGERVIGVVPEPATMSLLALGGLAILKRSRR